LIGIEKRVGDTWPNKQWGGYDELSKLVRSDGFEVREFHQRDGLRDYMDEIASCACIICGDTLSMHLALAYQIPCITIFNCTSPYEIHPYDKLKKITSPMLKENFYSRAYSKEIIDSVPVEEVYNAFKQVGLRK
jgi:ADP-heptose:LPS heptosyltransferase